MKITVTIIELITETEKQMHEKKQHRKLPGKTFSVEILSEKASVGNPHAQNTEINESKHVQPWKINIGYSLLYQNIKV